MAGAGTYLSAGFTPESPGTYQWVASYSGDAENNPVTVPCGDANERFVVGIVIVDVFLTTHASPSVAVGGQINDTATLAGATDPSGTVFFSLFGPDEATCHGPAAFISSARAADDGTFTSSPFTATVPGAYRWLANYSGDANVGPLSGTCNDPGEDVVVTPAQPTITTTATATARMGESIHDRATLSGGFNPTGTIAFDAYRPGDTSCGMAPVFTAVVGVAGNGTYESPAFTPMAAGTYRWTASYGGDGGNTAASSPCGAPDESSVVSLVPGPVCQILTWLGSRWPLLQRLSVALGC